MLSVTALVLVALFTVTPDDECTFCIRMYANQGKEINIPTPYCIDAECIQDLNIAIKKELNTLEHVLLITKLPCKLSWDYKKYCNKGISMFVEPMKNKADLHDMVIV
jgi:hypothetical protein